MYVLTADYKNANAATIFVESLKNTGFAVVKNHPIPVQLINDVYAEWQQFFASEEKMQYLYNKETQEGYFPFRQENAKGVAVKDLKEFYMLYPWGRYPAQLSQKTKELYDRMSQLAAELLQWVEAGTPNAIQTQFSVPLSKMITNSPRTVLRILHYPPLRGDEDPNAVRAAAHEDIDLMTLLPAATAMGLQVKDKQGNWHEVPSDPGTIVVNAGDMLQLCSQRYYVSTTHQVINPQGEAAKQSRLSMPLFVHPHDDVQLSEQHTAGSYLLERLIEIGLV